MQAILITAYKNKNQLQKLIDFFSPNNYVLIHIDKNSIIKPTDLIINNNVKVFKKYTINWGSINHLLAIVDLLKTAITLPNVKYIHLISGEDIPIKGIDEFIKFETCNNIYLQCESITNKILFFKNRYRKGCLFSTKSSRDKKYRIINRIYGALHFPRKTIANFPEKNIYIGLVWGSFPVEVGQYIVNYVNTTNFPQGWKHIIIPEEFFFQTILCNSKYKAKIINNNLRYCDWDYRNGSSPAYLDDSDIPKIKKSSAFFARKIDSKISKNIITTFFDNL